MEIATDTPALPNYKTISPWAIVTLLFGLAAPLALVSILLWIVPLLGLFVGAIALRSIRHNQEQTSGNGFVWCGLFLSCFMLVYVPARMHFRHQELQTHAGTLADKVLDLMQHKQLHEVHHLSTRQFLSRDPQRSLADYYSEDPKYAEIFQRFADGEAVKKLAELQGEFKFQRETIEAYLGDAHADHFLVRYRIQPLTELNSAPFKLWLTVERQYDINTGEISWWFRHMQLSDPAKHR